MPDDHNPVADLLRRARDLRDFAGDTRAFWQLYLELIASAAGAESVTLLQAHRRGGSTEWKQLLCWPSSDALPGPVARKVVGLAEGAAGMGFESGTIEPGKSGGSRAIMVVRLAVPGDADTVAGIVFPAGDTPGLQDTRSRLLLLSDLAMDYQREMAAADVKAEMATYRSVVETVALVHEQQHFVASCISLCNELAAHFDCDQVALGVHENGEYVRLKAISQMAKFDKKAGVVRSLEVTMEEAVDQAEEILLPVPGGAGYVVRSHEQYARQRGIENLCTLPIRHEGEIVAAVTCERPDNVFSESEIRQVELICELCAARLMELQEKDRWFIPRSIASARRFFSKFAGTERTLTKVLGVTAALVLLVMFTVRVTYRADASFILKAEKMAHITVPFDGTIAEVDATVGEEVAEGDRLIALDTRALLLEKVSAAADLQRYQREAERNMAIEALAEMRISEALAEQSSARLKLIEYKLGQAEVCTPFDGIIVEGDWSDKINSPVRRGEVLMKVAQLDSMYVELKIDSYHISRLAEGAEGEIAFLSDPGRKYPVRMTRIHPAAVPGEKQPVFIARAESLGPVLDWWRPGMSGMARIEVGRKSLWWIFTHRTSDFLRRKLWW